MTDNHLNDKQKELVRELISMAEVIDSYCYCTPEDFARRDEIKKELGLND